MRATPAALAASLILSALALTSCATGDTTMPDRNPGASRPPFQTSSPEPIAPTGAPAEVPTTKWEALVADLAALGVTGEPELVSAESVTFADGSLGCGKPGQSYTQAVVDGMRVVVRVGSKTFDYRFGEGDRPKLCER
ncbi:hypothetical protein BKA24_000908 [Microbacterium marinum]|uniref:Lipoprotein n=1 Tax=Microbacterium marinum TaxID=421115 RepID=A0A7W7BR63_9MICO|nr:hypothetical protein [Microbacterium marinum]MBB4666199.1 hypothetical protein [Microbacterium marinum]